MYQCLATDFNSLEKKIQSTIRLITKYGYSAKFEILSNEVKEIPVYSIDPVSKTKFKVTTTLAEVINYNFEMPYFKVGDYIPVAVIEHDVIENDDITNMVYPIGDNSIIDKKWWTIKGYCDDCKDNYNRKKTVMLYNECDNTFRQIGTSCLKKYLGINVFNVLNGYTSITEILKEEIAIYNDNFFLQRKEIC